MENSKCPKINNFCYVCGHMVLKKEEKELKSLFSADFTKAYEHYFNETDSSGEDFTPNTVCKMCYNTLVNWIHKKGAQLPYVKPIIWIKDPTGHDVSRCYSCINFTQGMNRRKLKTKVYVPAFTAVLPLLRQKGDKLPKPPTPLSPHGSQRAETIFTNPTNVADVEWEPDFEDDGPQPLTQSEMDYIVARMGASQRNSEWLTSFLKSRKLTQQGVNATSYRKRQADFQTFYTVNDENTFAYCHDIPGLINKLGMEYNANDWRLFIDGSVSSLKAVLLHITNKKPSIPIGFGINKKETYETLGAILNKIKYEEQKWKICCDLKVVNILQGVIEKGGFPKYFCFLCNWDSRYRGNQYQCKDWILRTSDNQEQLRLHNEPMIQDIADILLPPLHIKLGISGKLIEVLVKDVNGAFECLKTIFPKLSNDKIRAGVLNGPDIRKLMKSEAFTNILTNNHLHAWNALKAIIEGVLGKNRVQSDEIKRRVDALLYFYEKINASMTLKLHFLHFHLDMFLQQLPQESDEQGERFHQVTMPMEKRFKGKKLDALLAEVCWWTSKISEYEDEGTEDSDLTRYEGHTEIDMPLNPLSSEDSGDQPTKRLKLSEPEASSSMDVYN